MSPCGECSYEWDNKHRKANANAMNRMRPTSVTNAIAVTARKIQRLLEELINRENGRDQRATNVYGLEPLPATPARQKQHTGEPKVTTQQETTCSSGNCATRMLIALPTSESSSTIRT